MPSKPSKHKTSVDKRGKDKPASTATTISAATAATKATTSPAASTTEVQQGALPNSSAPLPPSLEDFLQVTAGKPTPFEAKPVPGMEMWFSNPENPVHRSLGDKYPGLIPALQGKSLPQPPARL